MSPLHLDFHRVHKPTPWLGLGLVVLGVVALLWVMTQQDIIAQYREQVETAWRKFLNIPGSSLKAKWLIAS